MWMQMWMLVVLLVPPFNIDLLAGGGEVSNFEVEFEVEFDVRLFP